MLRSVLLLSILFFSTLAVAQTPSGQNGAVFSFKETTHDFGKVDLDSALTYTFEFTNIGNAMLMITAIEPSCHCISVNWRRAPVMPGEKGTISVTYASPIDNGKFNRALWIASNATNVDPSTMRFELRVMGEGVKNLPRKKVTGRTNSRKHVR